jgi:hypothetical protein
MKGREYKIKMIAIPLELQFDIFLMERIWYSEQQEVFRK